MLQHVVSIVRNAELIMLIFAISCPALLRLGLFLFCTETVMDLQSPVFVDWTVWKFQLIMYDIALCLGVFIESC